MLAPGVPGGTPLNQSMLLNSVNRQIEEKISFSVTASYGSANCLTWAVGKLKEINIDVEVSMFTSLSRAADGKSYLVM